jgi:hypothetical protein
VISSELSEERMKVASSSHASGDAVTAVRFEGQKETREMKIRDEDNATALHRARTRTYNTTLHSLIPPSSPRAPPPPPSPFSLFSPPPPPFSPFSQVQEASDMVSHLRLALSGERDTSSKTQAQLELATATLSILRDKIETLGTLNRLPLYSYTIVCVCVCVCTCLNEFVYICVRERGVLLLCGVEKEEEPVSVVF